MNKVKTITEILIEMATLPSSHPYGNNAVKQHYTNEINSLFDKAINPRNETRPQT